MDFGLVFFFIFVAFWILFIRSRVRSGARTRTLRPISARTGVPLQSLSVVGVDELEPAISGLMAITGDSPAQARAKLTDLPFTISVAPGDFATTLEVLAESGIAYATGSLTAAPRSAPPEPPPVAPNPAPPVAAPTAPPIEVPASLGDPEASPLEQPSGTQDPNAALSPAAPDSGDGMEPTWASLDPAEAPSEVFAAVAEPDRVAAERTLRRLSMNGLREADVALGNLLADWGRTGEAEGLLRSRAHDNHVAANNLGVIDELEGRMAAARRNYQRAAEMGNDAASANLARLGS